MGMLFGFSIALVAVMVWLLWSCVALAARADSRLSRFQHEQERKLETYCQPIRRYRLPLRNCIGAVLTQMKNQQNRGPSRRGQAAVNRKQQEKT